MVTLKIRNFIRECIVYETRRKEEREILIIFLISSSFESTQKCSRIKLLCVNSTFHILIRLYLY